LAKEPLTSVSLDQDPGGDFNDRRKIERTMFISFRFQNLR